MKPSHATANRWVRYYVYAVVVYAVGGGVVWIIGASLGWWRW